MSMEHLVLGLVLLSGTLAAGYPLNLKAIEEKVLDMACTSFDDQYQGCIPEMEKELVELNRTEFLENPIYATTWTHAAAEWRKKGGHVPRSTALRTEHAVALMAYTLQECLYPVFNAAVRKAGLSRREYLDNFQFKTLHFLLTEALTILRKPQTCHKVFRGVKGIRFTAERHDLVRFGQFASASFSEAVAEDFGNDTFFFVDTCYGAPIEDFSAFPEEYEVLIPPFERFEVTSITKLGKSTHIHLKSKGEFSNYNCEWVKEKRCQNQPCDFSAGRTIVEDLPAPLGAPPGRHGTGRHGGTLSPNATNATAPRRRVQDGSRHRHRDGGTGEDSLWG